MIERIEKPEQQDWVIAFGGRPHRELIDKINELVEAVNRLEKDVFKCSRPFEPEWHKMSKEADKQKTRLGL